MTQQRPNREQRRRSGRTGEQPPQTQVQFPYIKSTITPVLHIDGVYGGTTPRGMIYLAFFSEHAAIPGAATIDLDMANKKFREIQPVGETNIVREVGAEIMITVDFARSLRRWLDDKITNIEQRRPEDSFTSTELEQQQ